MNKLQINARMKMNIGLQLKKDEKPWYGCGGT